MTKWQKIRAHEDVFESKVSVAGLWIKISNIQYANSLM